ncbi:MAG: hypothetical protein HY711_06010 [Candidatus Melainabacteria bacterium]|nr:hypothetical protein [Candidatus Melainabacteria bacterium]
MKLQSKVKLRIFTIVLVLLSMTVSNICLPIHAAEPFKLGVEEKGYVQSQPVQGYADYPAYPTPPMTPQQGRSGSYAPMSGRAATSAPLSGSAAATTRPPIQAGITRVALPPPFLGVWNVQGQRIKVEAQPEFQAGAERSFAINTQNIWEIIGEPNAGYTMGSSTGIRTQLVVDKVQGNTAFIRYQHPVGNTMAQEAIVMTLVPGGVQFNGLERISIVKPNQAQPRARVTYQLVGQRQR